MCRLDLTGRFTFDTSVPPNKEKGIIFFTVEVGLIMDLSKEIDSVNFLSFFYPSEKKKSASHDHGDDIICTSHIYRLVITSITRVDLTRLAVANCNMI